MLESKCEGCRNKIVSGGKAKADFIYNIPLIFDLGLAIVKSVYIFAIR